MFAGKTVLVLGAGSSRDFGFPLGSSLAQGIISALSFAPDFTGGAPDIAAAVAATFAGDERAYLDAAGVVVTSLPGFNSIDDFLASHGADERVATMAKLAIASEIARHEAASQVKDIWNPTADEAATLAWARTTWARDLSTMAVTGVPKARSATTFDDLSIITFNYDRCAESLIGFLVKHALRLDDAELVGALDNLKVYRPYGGLGALPWNGRPGVEFGPITPDLVTMAREIKVYTEDLGDRPDLLEAQGKIDAADTVLALGFGFHTQNMNILRPTEATRGKGRKVLASLTSEDVSTHTAIRERVRRTFGEAKFSPGAPNVDCRAFVHQHRLEIAY